MCITLSGCGQVGDKIALPGPVEYDNEDIVIAGDSIAHRFGLKQGQYLGAGYVNTAVSGQTAAELASDINDQILNHTSANIVILNIGVNSVTDLSTTPSIKFIIDSCLNNDKMLIVDTVPYIYDELWKSDRINEVNDWLIANYSNKVNIVMLHKLITRDLTIDDLHPSSEGYYAMNKEYYKILQGVK